MALVIICFGLSYSAFAAKAGDQHDQGLKTGATIPLAMRTTDQQGKTGSLKTLTGRSGLILLFTRSLDW